MLIYGECRPLDPQALLSVRMCIDLLCWLHLEVWLMMGEIPFKNYRCRFSLVLLSTPSPSPRVSLFHFVSAQWKITITANASLCICSTQLSQTKFT